MSTNAPRENASSPPPTKNRDKGGTRAKEFQISTFTGLLIFVVVALAVYSQLFKADFIWDDDAMLWNNALMHARNGLSQIWFSSNQSDYFPMTYSSLWFEWHTWGMHAKNYHITNILLHALGAFFLWRTLLALKIPGGFWAALLFVVHPVNVESVAWIAERKNTLSMVFFALAALFYVRFDNKNLKTSQAKLPNDYWFALGAFVLALLSKTAVVMFPFVALGCAWWIHGKLTRKDLLRSLPFFGVALILGLITIWFQYTRAINTEVVNANSLPTRIAVAGWNVWFYLYKALAPINLMFVYPRWVVDGKNLLAYLPGIAVIAVGVVLWLWRKKWGHGPLAAFAYFVITLVPVLGFLNIYFFRYSFVADHYQYFSIIAVVALLAAAATHFLKERAIVLMVILTAGLSILTWKQTAIYKNQKTLWRDTLKKNPTCAMAESNWGFWLAETEHRPAEAIEHYIAALKLNPNDAGTHYNYGVALLGQNQLDAGINEFRETLKISPDNLFALQNLAWIEATTKHAHLRNPEHAVQLARRSVELTKEKDEWKLDTLAAALAATGKFEEAISLQEKAITIIRPKGDANATADMEQRLSLYQRKQPFREAE